MTPIQDDSYTFIKQERLRMDEVIFRAFHGHASPAETEMLRNWRDRDAGNERRYRELNLFLGDTQKAATDTLSPPPAVAELITPSQPHGRHSTIHPKGSSRKVNRLYLGSVLAAAVAIIVLGLGLSRENADSGLLGSGEIVTGATETTTIGLADGTVVRLAPSSRLRVTGGAGIREVWLDGRAYFAVAKQQGAPFRVRTHAGEAVVLGTRFDLEARSDNLQLLVIEGAVNMAAGGGSQAVEAGHAAVANRSQAPVVIAVDESYVREETKWVGDFLAFEDTPLSSVARELTAHFGVPVEVLDSTLARHTVRGMFTEQTLDAILTQICRAVSGRCSLTPNGATIAP